MDAEMTRWLLQYFMQGMMPYPWSRVGTEIETQFVNDTDGQPISIATSQAILRRLGNIPGWRTEYSGSKVVKVIGPKGETVLYELGRSNLEVSASPTSPGRVVREIRTVLEQLYAAAGENKAQPLFQPIIQVPDPTELLVLPDDRDANFAQLDGVNALAPLCTCSAVQFVVDVSPSRAIAALNGLGAHLPFFLAQYPQEAIWRRYVAEAAAGYDPLRYGGPTGFEDIVHYCEELSEHRVIRGTTLVPFAEVKEKMTSEGLTLFLRSVWWYFRLRRYGPQLCVEVRPLPRLSDHDLQNQLDFVLAIMG